MPQRKKPCTLEKLALDALCLQVSSVAWTLMSSHCTNNVVELDLDASPRAILDSGALKQFVNSNLPRVLASKMMSHFLGDILNLTCQARCTKDGFLTTGDNCCRDIVKDLLLAVVTPHITQLDISNETQLIRKVLCENLSKFPNLEVLTMRASQKWERTEDIFLRGLSSLENLVSFTMKQDCSDKIVGALAQHNRKLKILNVSGSADVTDKSIESILKLQQLEKLELTTTSITEIGFVNLLTQMACPDADSILTEDEEGIVPSPLKMLGCSFVKNNLLLILRKYYHNLSHISLSSMHCDLSILKELNQLEHLVLTGGNFVTDNIKGLLKETGAAMKVLDFLFIQEIDVIWIGKYCPNLQKFRVRSCSISGQLPLPGKKCKEPMFQKVEELTFYLPCPLEYLHFILVNCTAVKTIMIGLSQDINDSFLAKVLSENPLIHLQEFNLLFSSHLTISTVQLLMKHCPSLNSLCGLETWFGISESDLAKLRLEIKRKNLDFNTINMV